MNNVMNLSLSLKSFSACWSLNFGPSLLAEGINGKDSMEFSYFPGEPNNLKRHLFDSPNSFYTSHLSITVHEKDIIKYEVMYI